MTEQYKQSLQNWRAYAPGVDEVMAPPPAPIEIEQAEPSPNSKQTQAGLIVIVFVNLLVTAIIVCVMLFDGTTASEALERGTRYFTITTPIYLIIITGSLVRILGRWARERTERQRIRAYERVMVVAFQWRQAVEANRTAELQAQALPSQLQRRIAALETELLEQRISAGGVQTPSGRNTFVTPYDNRSKAAFSEETEPPTDTTANEAMQWLNSLYDELGNVDRRKVNSDGRLKVRMIGSSRGPGSREAGRWLIQRGVIYKVPGGFALNLQHYRTRESLRNLF